MSWIGAWIGVSERARLLTVGSREFPRTSCSLLGRIVNEGKMPVLKNSRKLTNVPIISLLRSVADLLPRYLAFGANTTHRGPYGKQISNQ